MAAKGLNYEEDVTIRSPTFTYLFHKPAKDTTSSGRPNEHEGLLSDIDKLKGLRSLLLARSMEEGPTTALWRIETTKLAQKMYQDHSDRSWSGWLNELYYIYFRIEDNWMLWKKGPNEDGTLGI
ncbi:MAG: hypothetical protein Q9207_005356 [Kuettlingeria erythrocarpa]